MLRRSPHCGKMQVHQWGIGVKFTPDEQAEENNADGVANQCRQGEPALGTALNDTEDEADDRQRGKDLSLDIQTRSGDLGFGKELAGEDRDGEGHGLEDWVRPWR